MNIDLLLYEILTTCRWNFNNNNNNNKDLTMILTFPCLVECFPPNTGKLCNGLFPEFYLHTKLLNTGRPAGLWGYTQNQQNTPDPHKYKLQMCDECGTAHLSAPDQQKATWAWLTWCTKTINLSHAMWRTHTHTHTMSHFWLGQIRKKKKSTSFQWLQFEPLDNTSLFLSLPPVQKSGRQKDKKVKTQSQLLITTHSYHCVTKFIFL